MRTTPCKACGRPIVFVKTAQGRHLPVDPEPVLVVRRGPGTAVIVNGRGEVIRGYTVDAPPDPEHGRHVGRVPHWATCSDPERFRRN